MSQSRFFKSTFYISKEEHMWKSYRSRSHAGWGCCRKEAQEAQGEAERAAAEADKLEGRLRESRAKLEQRRSASSAQRSASAVVQALMEAKASGHIAGIHGRLGGFLVLLNAGCASRILTQGALCKQVQRVCGRLHQRLCGSSCT